MCQADATEHEMYEEFDDEDEDEDDIASKEDPDEEEKKAARRGGGVTSRIKTLQRYGQNLQNYAGFIASYGEKVKK